MKPLPGRLVLLGHPVEHSLSPTFQNAALRRAGLPITYEAVDVAPDALDATLDGLVGVNAAGNVTIPHKHAVFGRCGRRSELAERVGAVNTFWVENETLCGDNTDVGGFLDLLGASAPNVDRNRPVAVIGAGGSAAAVLAALDHQRFAEVRLNGRTAVRAVALAERFAIAHAVMSVAEAVRDASLVVNATPAGLDGRRVPFDVALVEHDAVVLDLVYAYRAETPLVRAARARGLSAASGLEMLLGQGARSFELWFGVAPDRRVMRESL